MIRWLAALGAVGLAALTLVSCDDGGNPYGPGPREGINHPRNLLRRLAGGPGGGPPPLLQKVLPGANQGPLGSSRQGPLMRGYGNFVLGMTTLQFPWQGFLRTNDFDLQPSDDFTASFDFEVDLARAERYFEELDEIYVVVVGEPVYKQDGTRTGFSGITLTTRKTVAGILWSSEGTLPVGSSAPRGSFEDVVAFPVESSGSHKASAPQGHPVRVSGGRPRSWYRPTWSCSRSSRAATSASTCSTWVSPWDAG